MIINEGKLKKKQKIKNIFSHRTQCTERREHESSESANV